MRKSAGVSRRTESCAPYTLARHLALIVLAYRNMKISDAKHRQGFESMRRRVGSWDILSQPGPECKGRSALPSGYRTILCIPNTLRPHNCRAPCPRIPRTPQTAPKPPIRCMERRRDTVVTYLRIGINKKVLVAQLDIGTKTPMSAPKD